ncbi:MAG: MarR family transcriptional regulator [Bacteroidia bacterium]|nr:MarR family transcriptional regulator [Bacteroidia bacterium]
MLEEKSVFDLEEQNTHLVSRMVVALERISEAFRVLLWQEGMREKLSPIQIQLLIFIATHSTGHCTVSCLAREFNLTKATISDAVKALEKKELIGKMPSSTDSRSYYIRLTPQAGPLVERLQMFANAFKGPIAHLDTQQQSDLWQSLLTLLRSLQQSGIISQQRMCFSCAYYRQENGGHFCGLLKIPHKK